MLERRNCWNEESETVKSVETLALKTRKEQRACAKSMELQKLEEMKKELDNMRKAVHKMLKKIEKYVLPLCDDTVTRKYLRKELLAIGDPKHPKDPAELVSHFKSNVKTADPKITYAQISEHTLETAIGYRGLMDNYRLFRKLTQRLNRYYERKKAEQTADVSLNAPVGTLFQQSAKPAVKRPPMTQTATPAPRYS